MNGVEMRSLFILFVFAIFACSNSNNIGVASSRLVTVQATTTYVPYGATYDIGYFAPNRGAFLVRIHPSIISALGKNIGDAIKISYGSNWAYYQIEGTESYWSRKWPYAPVYLGVDARNRIGAPQYATVVVSDDTETEAWDQTLTGPHSVRVALADYVLSVYDAYPDQRLCLTSDVRRGMGLREPDVLNNGEVKEQIRVYVDSDGDGALDENEHSTVQLFTVISECDYFYHVPAVGGPFQENPVHMSYYALARLGVQDGAKVLVDERAVDESYPQTSNMVFETSYDDEDDRFVALAPHGTWMEPNTELQADIVVSELEFGSMWGLKAYSTVGAFNAFHIAATDIDNSKDGDVHPHRAFPELASISGRTFDDAVSFHGFLYYGDEGCPIDNRTSNFSAVVLVGGGASYAKRFAVANAIEDALDLSVDPGVCVDVVLVDPMNHPLGGGFSTNIVNWISVDGVQIEQSATAVYDYHEEIAEAVASVYAE